PLIAGETPFTEVDVQPGAEGRVRPHVRSGLRGRGLPDHQRRRRDDAALVGPHDAGVDSGTQPEVVGVDDEALHSPRSSSSLRNTDSARKYSWAICCAAAL